MATAGIRDLKNNLSRYLRRVAAGERIVVTDHGRIVAELVPPSTSPSARIPEHMIRRAREKGPLFTKWPDIRLPPGTVAALIDEDRDER